MSYERLEGRVTMYIAMAIYIHLTGSIFYGLWSLGVITMAFFAGWFFTPQMLDRLQNRTR